MSAGQSAAQAGHAFLDSFLTSPPEIAKAYRDDGGTKIVLTAPDEAALCLLFHKAKLAGLPCAMVIEDDYQQAPFNGRPTATAIGIGPVWRAQVRPVTKRLALMR